MTMLGVFSYNSNASFTVRLKVAFGCLIFHLYLIRFKVLHVFRILLVFEIFLLISGTPPCFLSFVKALNILDVSRLLTFMQ
jgi:hypothetical protein